jgi:ribosomal protein S18 acetylase RimI-like enzyme
MIRGSSKDEEHQGKLESHPALRVDWHQRELTMEFRIRPATVFDAANIPRLHLRAWRDTYKGLATVEAFNIMDEAFRHKRWQRTLSEPGPHQLAVIAEHEGLVVGIGLSGAPGHAIFGGRGEIRSLYVDPVYKRRGLGRLLLRHLGTNLADHGYVGAALGVVVGNHPAVAFYQSLGARSVGHYTDPGPIWRSENIAFVWDELTALTEAASDQPSVPQP